jgi:hypothetical protein
MNELKFNSQVCTTKEQSERLLKLGLKPETADMYYHEGSEDGAGNIEFHCNIRTEYNNILFPDYIPAWSLHRLIHLCGAECMPISFYKKGKVMIRVNHIHPTHNGRSNYNHYDSLIDCIEWLINKHFFNKQYLKE